MKAIVGIGNPGKEYEKTRHNIGFQVLDALKKEGVAGRVVLEKPATFVNRTGDAVARLAKKHGLAPQDVLVVCDDVNLAFGKLRLRARGSSGGHKGLESVIQAIGADFPRLRVGVKNESTPKDLALFVLEKFSREEAKQIPGLLEKAVSVCQAWAAENFDSGLNRLSRVQSNQDRGVKE